MNLWDAVASLFRRKPKPAAKPVAGGAYLRGTASGSARIGKRMSGAGVVSGRASGGVGVGSRAGEIDIELDLP